MSLQHVFRAEQLGRCFEEPEKLARLAGQELGSIRADRSGCNLLMVYLLNRWGRLFEPNSSDELEYSADFHFDVIRAYLAAGCDPDDAVAPVKIYLHTPPNFRFNVEESLERITGKMSSKGFVQFVIDEYPRDANPSIHDQLLGVAKLIDELTAGEQRRPGDPETRMDQGGLPVPVSR